MADNNQTNDIAEMLMRLRQSVEADRAKAEKSDKKPEAKAEEREKDEFELQLQEFAEEMKALEGEAETEEAEVSEEAPEDDEDPWYEDEVPEDEEEDFDEVPEDEEEDFDEVPEDEEGCDIIIASAEEREDEEDDEDPWLVKKEDEPEMSDDTSEESPEPEIIEEIEETVEETEETEEIEESEEMPIDLEAEEEEDILTPEMIAEAEAEDEEDTDEDEDLPSWYAEESERVAPAERSDYLEDDEGETFFDFDDWANGVPPVPSEIEDDEESSEEIEDFEEPEEIEEFEEPEDIGELEEPEKIEEFEEYVEPEEDQDPMDADEFIAEENDVVNYNEPYDPDRSTEEMVVEADDILDDIEELKAMFSTPRKGDNAETEDAESLEDELYEVDQAEESGFDETDLEFLQQIGYAAEVGGEEVVKQNETPESYVKEPFGDVAYDNDGEEYVTPSQKERIKAEYAVEKKNALLRFYIAGGAALLLFVYEMLCFSGVSLPWMFNQKLYPLSHAMVSLQLLLIAAAMSFRMIAKGISDLFCMRVTPYSVVGVSVLLNIIYTIVISIVQSDKYALFNFMPALAVLLGLLYEYVMAVNEERAFAVATKDDVSRFALCDDEAEGSPVGDEPALRAYGTDFNKNFFAHMGKRSVEYKYLSILILSVFSAALITLAAVWIATGNGGEGARAAMLMVNFSLPLGAMGAYCLPMLGSLVSLGGKGAVIGHVSADKYEKTRFVTFDEVDLFPSMKTTHVDLKPSGNRHISEVLRKTGRLFSAIGGPLSGMVEIRNGDADGTEIVGIFDNGIAAVVDGSPMLAGDATFMQINGVDINAPTDHRDADTQSEILYISIDGKLAARYYIKYIPDEDFVKAVNMLGDRGISVGIRTRNPGVNSKIIEKRCPEMKYKVYTLKAVADDERDLVSHRNVTVSGLIAHGKAAHLAKPLVAAIAMKKYYKLDTYLRIVSAVLGAIIVASFAILGRLADIGSLAAAIYQLVWFIPCAIALLSLKKKKD